MYVCLYDCRSVLLLVLVPLQWHTQKDNRMAIEHSTIEVAGFLTMAFLQSLVTFLLFLALDHERQFRSAGMYVCGLCLCLFSTWSQ